MIVARSAAILVAIAIAASSAHAVGIDCGSTTAARGGGAAVAVTLTNDPKTEVAGTQNDLEFDDTILTLDLANCAINPNIGPGTDTNKRLENSLLADPPRVRNIVVSLENANPIPDGELYTCAFEVDPEAPLGDIILVNTGLVASDPQGNRLPVTGTDCSISIVECIDDADCPNGQVCVDGTCIDATPIPTPTPECTDDNDCPPGQVCVDGMCVEATPTPIPECSDDDDCPPGQVCVNGVCVEATPTPSTGGGGGCNCKIDPNASRSGAPGILVLLLPAILLWLRRRTTKTKGLRD